MHAMQVVKEIANLYDIWLVIELIFFCFHGISSIKSLTRIEWVGPTRYRGPHPLPGRGQERSICRSNLII